MSYAVPAAARPEAAPVPPLVVIDTQVVLDWLVFADPTTGPLAAAVERRALRWVATEAMHAELMHVLGRGRLRLRRLPAPDPQALSQRFLDCSERHARAPATLPSLRCRDQDDQMFIDLAVAAGARWLFTRDRDLLTMRRKAATHGVTVLRPADWLAAD